MLLNEITATSAHSLYLKGLITLRQLRSALERITEREYGEVLEPLL